MDQSGNDGTYVRLGQQELRFRLPCFCASLLFCAIGCVILTVTPSNFGNNSDLSALDHVDRVWSLPGAPRLQQIHRAGFVPVNRSFGNYLFYWFVESQRVRLGENPSDIPLVIWLNGGPGASSQTGFVIEGTGPYILNPDGATLSKNPNGWDQLAHVLSWDPSVGGGYSYSESGPKGYPRHMQDFASEMVEGMIQFYARNPQYAKSKVFVVGESFAGKTIPYLCTAIEKVNHAAGHDVVPLVGFAIGNGVLKPLLQYHAVLDVARTLGYAGKKEIDQGKIWLEECKSFLTSNPPDYEKAYKACQRVEDNMYLGSDPFVYDLRVGTAAFDSINGYMTQYFNRPAVRRALNVGERQWVQKDGGDPANIVSDLLWAPQIDDIPAGMLENLITKYSALLYAGNMDLSSCNPLGVSRVIDTLQWPGAAAFKNNARCVWNMDGEAAGVVQRGGGLTWLVFLNSGHLVPMSQPQRALQMVRMLIEGRLDSFCTGK